MLPKNLGRVCIKIVKLVNAIITIPILLFYFGYTLFQIGVIVIS